MSNPVEFGKELAKLLGVKGDILPSQEQMDAIKQLAEQQLGGGQPQQAPATI